ncbi:dethiobiotin synthase, partial [Jatrophihabitans sp.]|uniref:dethiobiotin synthase n=1 Tax=Jatrophihabitans sp. TaxID=1932789 RepID=UPI002C50359B|nr:dethiobiotin synthase [Jatrophihabitans sp.]
MSVLVVTGTGTGVGKTVTTAALAACGLRAGRRVAVVKPVQTGVRTGEPGDLAEVGLLTGLADLHEYVRFSEPLAPATAARRAGESGPDLAELADRIAGLADRDLVLIEGAGGALVRFNDRDETICTLATELRRLNRQVRVVLVTGSALGALHDAAATAAALRSRSLDPDALVVGDWPAEPGLAERCNLVDLAGYGGAPVEGVLPHGAAELAPAAFAEL